MLEQVSYGFIFLLVEGAAELLGAVRLAPTPPPAPAPAASAAPVGGMTLRGRLTRSTPAAPVGGMTLRGRPTRSASTLYASAALPSVEQRRKWKLKAKLESSFITFHFQALKSGPFEHGFDRVHLHRPTVV